MLESPFSSSQEIHLTNRSDANIATGLMGWYLLALMSMLQTQVVADWLTTWPVPGDFYTQGTSLYMYSAKITNTRQENKILHQNFICLSTCIHIGAFFPKLDQILITRCAAVKWFPNRCITLLNVASASTEVALRQQILPKQPFGHHFCHLLQL